MNGLDPSGWSEEDCWAIAAMLHKTDRAIHPAQWVDELIEQAGIESFQALM